MNKYLLLFLILLIFVSPAFADGKLNVTRGLLTTPAYINTQSITPVLNITFNVTNTNDANEVNVSSIFFNLTGTAYSGNVSGIFVYNDSDNDGVIGNSDRLLGSNTVWNETNGEFAVMQVNFTSNLTILNNTNKFIIIALNISSNAESVLTAGINISLNTSISTGNPNDFIAFPSLYINSTPSQIQDVHATGDITPNYVDTNVINQSALLTLNITGSDNFENITFTFPSSYPIVAVSEVSNSTSIIYNSTLPDFLNVTFGGFMINISNFTLGFNSADSFIKINFTINTSITAVSALKFNVSMTGSNLSGISTTETTIGSQNITTQQMINITTVTVTKSTAIVNGTDYWEFNITVNITANTSGILQFRMNNWNSTTQGYGLLNVTNETGAFVENVTYRATLRNQTAQTGSSQLNVTTDYGNLTRGLSLAYTGTTKTLILKMIIPTGMPYTNDWWSTYYILFRSST